MEKANRNFRAFLLGRVIAAAGATLAPLLLTFSSLAHQPDGGLLAGVMGIQIALQLCALMIGGVLIDRWNRKTYITSCYLVSSLTFGALAVFLLTGQIGSELLLCFGALTGLMSGLTGPSIQSVMPQLVADEDLREKNATLRIALNTVVVIAPAAGGWVMTQVDLGWISLYIAATYLLAALAMARLPQLKRAKPSNMVTDLREGWSAFTRTRWFIVAVCACAVMNMLWAGFYQVVGPVSVNSSDAGPQAWGVITATLSAGLIAGGFIFKKLNFKQPISAAMLSLASKALPLAAIGFGAPIWVIALAALFSGVLVECFVINFYTTAQKHMLENHLGKLLSIDAFIGLGLMPLGYGLAALAMAQGEISTWTVSAAAATVLIALTASKFSRVSPAPSDERPREEESLAK